MKLRYGTTRLLVKDFDACFRFYRDVMGLELRLRTEGNTYAEFITGDVSLALYRRDLMADVAGVTGRPIEAASQDRLALTFEVEDVDAAYEYLLSQGAEAAVAPQDRSDWFLRIAHVRDPDGNLIEVNAPLRAA